MKALPVLSLIGTAIVAGAAGFLAYRQLATRTAPPAAPHPLPAPQAPPEAPARPDGAAGGPPAAAQRTAIPEEVPDLQLKDLAGKLHPLRSSSGEPRLYNFWATWCEPCRREIPLLNALQRQHRAEGLQIVGIAVDFSDAVRKFIRRTPLDYTLLVGEEDGLEAAQRFGMEMLLPFSVFADGQHRIVAVKVGELHQDEAGAILDTMHALRAGALTLPQARAAISAALQRLSTQRAKQSATS